MGEDEAFSRETQKIAGFWLQLVILPKDLLLLRGENMGACYRVELYAKMLDHLPLARNTITMMARRLELLP